MPVVNLPGKRSETHHAGNQSFGAATNFDVKPSGMHPARRDGHIYTLVLPWWQRRDEAGDSRTEHPPAELPTSQGDNSIARAAAGVQNTPAAGNGNCCCLAHCLLRRPQSLISLSSVITEVHVPGHIPMEVEIAPRDGCLLICPVSDKLDVTVHKADIVL